MGTRPTCDRNRVSSPSGRSNPQILRLRAVSTATDSVFLFAIECTGGVSKVKRTKTDLNIPAMDHCKHP